MSQSQLPKGHLVVWTITAIIATICAFLVWYFLKATAPSGSVSAPQKASAGSGMITIADPVSPGQFPMLGEQNQIFGYWLWSQLVGIDRISSWSLVDSTNWISPQNVNTARILIDRIPTGINIRFEVDSELQVEVSTFGNGLISIGGEEFNFSYQATTAQEAEGVARTGIVMQSIEPPLEALFSKMQTGQKMDVIIGNLRLGFSLAGFGDALRRLQEK